MEFWKCGVMVYWRKLGAKSLEQKAGSIEQREWGEMESWRIEN